MHPSVKGLSSYVWLEMLLSFTRMNCLVFLLQVLPAGASKGQGVEQLLKHLDIKADRVLALGDGENDKVMLQVHAVQCVMMIGTNHMQAGIQSVASVTSIA